MHIWWLNGSNLTAVREHHRLPDAQRPQQAHQEKIRHCSVTFCISSSVYGVKRHIHLKTHESWGARSLLFGTGSSCEVLSNPVVSGQTLYTELLVYPGPQSSIFSDQLRRPAGGRGSEWS